jgi:hypothetical protein
MKSSAGLIAGVILGGLIAMVGIWLLVDGISCVQAINALVGGNIGGLESTCYTYEAGGVATLLLAVGIIVAGVLSSRSSGRSGRRRR